MKTPHKHAALIKAWADGAEIEYKYFRSGQWIQIGTPNWDATVEYRIKPEPKPDRVYYGVFDGVGGVMLDSCFTAIEDDGDHIRIIFDGDTGKLKSAEVL